MSILKRISEEDICNTFTHKGWYAGIIPVYLVLPEGIEGEHGNVVKDVPMTERNWIPEWSIPVGVFIWSVLTVFHPITPPMIITEEL